MSSIIVNEPEKPSNKKFCFGVVTLITLLSVIFTAVFFTRETVILNPMISVYQSEPDFSLYTMDPYNLSRT
jgi:hypothetical protein